MPTTACIPRAYLDGNTGAGSRFIGRTHRNAGPLPRHLPTQFLPVVHRDPLLPLRRLQQHAPQPEAPKPDVRHPLLLCGPACGSQQLEALDEVRVRSLG